MFQDYALFPHMSVADNVGYGLMIKGVVKAERLKRVEEMLAMVRLPGLGGRDPHKGNPGKQGQKKMAHV